MRPRGPGAARRAGELLHRDRRRLRGREHRRGPRDRRQTARVLERVQAQGHGGGAGPERECSPTESNANTGNASFGLFAGRFKKRFKNGAEEKKSARRTTGGGTTGSFGVTGKDSPRDGNASFETIACDGGVLRDECLTCPYHGWTYDLTGALVKVPRLAGTEAFETNENGLREIAVSVWGPFVWCAFLDDSSSNRGTKMTWTLRIRRLLLRIRRLLLRIRRLLLRIRHLPV